MKFQKTKDCGDTKSREMILQWFSEISKIQPVKVIDTGAGAGHFTMKLSSLALSKSEFVRIPGG